MIRSLYRCALRLHPPAFHKRFADEMLSIFDHCNGRLSHCKLLLDAFASLLRQWILRPAFRHGLSAGDSPQPAPYGIPSFYTIGAFRPRKTAVIHGLVLTSAIFCLTCFAIKYSWIHVLHVRIPEFAFEGSRPIPPHPRPDSFRSAPTAPVSREQAVSPSALPSDQTQASHRPTEHRTLRSTANPKSAAVPKASRQRSVERQSPEQGPSSQSAAVLEKSEGSQANERPVIARASARAGHEVSSISAAERKQIVDALIAKLSRSYVDSVLGKKMSAALESHQERGDYDWEIDGPSFARLLTSQLRDISHDMHLEVVYSPSVLPNQPAEQTTESLARYRSLMLRQNCTFEKVEIQPRNVGYVKLNSFPDPSVCRKTALAAMASLNHADALIFDLRDNRGGEPEMVAMIAAYLFDHPEYWYNPRESTTERSWTRSPVPGNTLADKPVYVLTSASTYSGAEQFCYNLKMLKRATLIGETTGGAAHAGVWYRIDDHFGVGIPEVKPINPFSSPDWAGTGVEPDVRVPSQDALKTAQGLAELKLRKK
jgi:hypothetical protein